MCELQELFDQFEHGLRSGRISPDLVKAEVGDRVAKLVKDYPEIFLNDEELKYPEERWPKNKLIGERAIDFTIRTLGQGTKDIPFSKIKIRNEIFELYQALTTYFRRNHNDEQLLLWWKNSPIRSQDEVNSELENLDIKVPKDAFNRGLEGSEAARLYNACFRRQQKSQK